MINHSYHPLDDLSTPEYHSQFPLFNLRCPTTLLCSEQCVFEALSQNVYKGLIRPHMEYACIVWSPHRKGKIEATESAQRFSCRFKTVNCLADFLLPQNF